MIKEKEVNIPINNISFFGDHYEIIDLWMQYYGENFIKENQEIAKNKKYRVFYDKKKSEWKFSDQQKYGWCLIAGKNDGYIKGIVEEDENIAKANAASEIFTIRKEVNKKKRKKNSNSKVTTFASYVETCKKTYKNEFDESRSCPMSKPFCVHACEFYNKLYDECNFMCPNPKYHMNCSKCSHSYKLQFTDRDIIMCGYGTVKIIGMQEK